MAMLAAGFIAATMPPLPRHQFTPSLPYGGRYGPWSGHREAHQYRTRSIGEPFGGVIYERPMDLGPPNDDEIIIATVRVATSFRRLSVNGAKDLPSRPRRRGFIRRLSSRVGGSEEQRWTYRAIKMPRRDYKKWFVRDKNGDYAGTEPERDWDDEQLKVEFGRYQEMPLRSIPGGKEYGEGEAQRKKGTGEEAVVEELQGVADEEWWLEQSKRAAPPRDERSEVGPTDEEWWK